MTSKRRESGLIAIGLLAATLVTGCTSDISVDEEGNTIATDSQGRERRVVAEGETVPSLDMLYAEDVIIAAVQDTQEPLNSQQAEANRRTIAEFADADPDPVEGVDTAIDFIKRLHRMPDWYEEGGSHSNTVLRQSSVVLTDPYLLNMMTDDLRRDVATDAEGVAPPSVYSNGSIPVPDEGTMAFIKNEVPASVYTLPELSAPEEISADTPALELSGSRTIEWETPRGIVLQPTSYRLVVEYSDEGWKIADMEHDMQGPSMASPDYVPAQKPNPVEPVLHDKFTDIAPNMDVHGDGTAEQTFGESNPDIHQGVEKALEFMQSREDAGQLERTLDGELLVYPGGTTPALTDVQNIGHSLSLVKAETAESVDRLAVSGLSHAEFIVDSGLYAQESTWEVSLVPTDGSWMVVDHSFTPNPALPQVPDAP